MEIYFFLLEAIPYAENPEKKDIAGAYVACWVDSIDVETSKNRAINYINDKGWEVLGIKEQDIVTRSQYERDSDFQQYLDCLEEAISEGISTIFFVWTYDA